MVLEATPNDWFWIADDAPECRKLCTRQCIAVCNLPRMGNRCARIDLTPFEAYAIWHDIPLDDL